MNGNHLLKLIFIVSLISFLASCTAIKLIQQTKIVDPQIDFIDYKVGKASDKKVVVNLNFNANNPNEIGITNLFINYELYYQKKRLLKGDNIKLSLSPKADTKIIIPVEFIYQDIFRVAESFAKKLFSSAKTIPILVKVTIFGDPTIYNNKESGNLFSFETSFDQTIDVPIPRDQIKQAEFDAKKKLKHELNKLNSFFN